MLDIGWTELLVIAVILIVVVGPKDLPPMLRAFGKMTTRLRKTAGEFRSQFDEALREAELDDVRKTISDVQKLNPANSLRDAMNPLRQMGQDIKADMQKAVAVEMPAPSTGIDADDGPVEMPSPFPTPEPVAALSDLPPDLTAPAKTPVAPPATGTPSVPAASTSPATAAAAPVANPAPSPDAAAPASAKLPPAPMPDPAPAKAPPKKPAARKAPAKLVPAEAQATEQVAKPRRVAAKKTEKIIAAGDAAAPEVTAPAAKTAARPRKTSTSRKDKA